MQVERHDGSLVASLAELRAIEEQRIASERDAVREAQQALVRAREQAAQQLRDEEAARVAAAHDAAIQIQREREQAERSARMQLEAAETAERIRHQAAL